MKRWIATGLALCLFVQIVSGSAVQVHASDAGILQTQDADQVQGADGQQKEPEENDAGEPAGEDVKQTEAGMPDTQNSGMDSENAGSQTDGKQPGIEAAVTASQGDDKQAEPEKEDPAADKEQAEVKSDAPAENEQETETKGALVVELIQGLPFFEEKGLEATVSVAGLEAEEKTVTLAGNDGSASASALVRYNDVAQGSYEVTVKAEKFADYVQTVEVEARKASKIQVYSGQVAGEDASQAKPGWMLLGDVTKDGKVTAEDREAMLSAIRRGSAATGDKAVFDLNDDGLVDIADLQYIVQNIGEEQYCNNVEQLAIPNDIKGEKGTVVEGKLGDLLKGGEKVSLSPADNQAISADNPVGITFELAGENQEPQNMEAIALQAPVTEESDGNTYSSITDGVVEMVCVEAGKEVPKNISFKVDGKNGSAGPLAKASERMSLGSMLAGIFGPLEVHAADGAKVTVDAGGMLILDLGSQVAVKRVTLRITGTRKTQPLVEIARVEFVNNMENRIPAPELNIPEITKVEPGDEMLTVSWGKENNITGYEVYIAGPDDQEQITRVGNTTHIISSINNNDLKNFTEYTIKVRSVNGDWKSPWSKEQKAAPQPTKLPAPPDNVSVTGSYLSLAVSWKKMSDSDGYMVYYKETEDQNAEFKPVLEGFTKVPEGTGKLADNSYIITGLKENTQYSVYVIGWNQLGWGANSLISTGTTKSAQPPQVPKFELLNTPERDDAGVEVSGKVTSHIEDAVLGGSGGASMVGSPLDEGKPKSALGLVDNDYASYWTKPNDWDDGVSYPASDKGVTVTLDQDYKLNYLSFGTADETLRLNYVRIRYWSKDDSKTEKTVGASLLRKMDENQNPYYIVKLDEAITANKINLCVSTGYSRGAMKIAEIHFHQYNDLEERIMGLFNDAMHNKLAGSVTEEKIAELETELEKVDTASGEKHPLYDELKLEIQLAREILTGSQTDSYKVHNQITAKKDGHLGFGGLNAWQPLGKTVYAGESLIVYVSHNTKNMNASANLQLVFTQQHAESGAFMQTASLKVGRNSITVPKIGSTDTERGGQMYVAYTGNDASDEYFVRVAGGSDIPVLDLYKKTGEDRTAAIAAYVEKLEAYVSKIGEAHEQPGHKDKVSGTNKAYDAKNCILNTTDIMLEPMMYSLPATQIWGGIAKDPDKVKKLDNALKAMEDTMTLFYQHKGLSNEAGDVNGRNDLPSQHLNIRYMRMFAGAFMYASGNHIGIEWGSAPLASAPSDWNGFGWGVAHEIGHDINQGTYAIAEITNNYFAQLLTIEGSGVRWRSYDKIYKKVTSGAEGRSSNVAIQLALYWQLHLAYDDNKDDRHIYAGEDSYNNLFNNLFFARVDTYSRNPAKAPQAGLRLDGGTDQNLMRLSCAAANKNILTFFERWGMVPDAATKAYAEKYGAPEEKAIYYVNDAVRNYRVDHPEKDASLTVTGKDAVTEANAVTESGSNTVKITIKADDAYKDVLHGYEIMRKMTANGETKSQTAGFIEADAGGTTVFTDTIDAINNRVITYEIRAVDKYLNYSNVKGAGSVKIETGGQLNKEQWTIETEGLEAQADKIKNPLKDEDDAGSDTETDGWLTDDPDSGYHENDPSSVPAGAALRTIENVIDGDTTTIYEGTRTADTDKSVITIDMHQSERVTALRYQGSDLGSVDLEVSADGSTWTAVKSGYAVRKDTGKPYTEIWFDAVEEDARDNWIGTYDARYVRLTISGTEKVTIHEIEICGPSGDNVDFFTTDAGQAAIGILENDYVYDTDTTKDVIKKGSLIFTGTYKGNPAYNVVMVYDDKGNVIGSTEGSGVLEAGQVIFADVPEKGNLGETSNGTWVYYVEPGKWNQEDMKGLKVRAELYRVDNALTLEGERMVSDTQIISIPDTIPPITLTGSKSE